MVLLGVAIVLLGRFYAVARLFPRCCLVVAMVLLGGCYSVVMCFLGGCYGVSR